MGELERPAEGLAATFLCRLIAGEGGSISVERFMQEALYHPRHGYYSRRVGTLGRTGDFSTTATLHPALGVAVAAWARSHRREVAAEDGWHLVELGGGTGELAAEVLRSLGWWGSRRLTYHLVEISDGLRAQQQQRLSGRGNVRWHQRIESALEAAGGRALIFSNEFVDAFPCRQWQWDRCTKQWLEVRLSWADDQAHPQEIMVPWNRPLPRATALICNDAFRGRVETHLSYQVWLNSWAEAWRVGRLLTIDYGDTLPTLYSRRLQGTLRAYCRHLRFVGPEVYQRFGQQDITADINFADLQMWGKELGLTTTCFQTQADFFRRWLPGRQLVRSQTDAQLAFLLNEEGAGSAFKVLEQICHADLSSQKAA